MMEHVQVLSLYTFPIALIYAALFGLRVWRDFAWVTLITLALGAIAASSAHLSCIVRLLAGSFVADVRKRPLRPLILFDRECDPACIPVRECLCVLDIAVSVFPVPLINASKSLLKAPCTARFRGDLIARSPTGSDAVPMLEDPNTNIVLQGDADEILLYLYTTYARKGAHRNMGPPLAGTGGTRATAKLVCLLRSFQPYGLYAQPSLYNRRALRLYAHEGCAESRAVRERLCSLQLHFEYVTCAQGGTGRVQLVHQIGQLRTPVLFDPSTSKLAEGARACLRYLDQTFDCSSVIQLQLRRLRARRRAWVQQQRQQQQLQERIAQEEGVSSAAAAAAGAAAAAEDEEEGSASEAGAVVGGADGHEESDGEENASANMYGGSMQGLRARSAHSVSAT
jgi:hypothetical protein